MSHFLIEVPHSADKIACARVVQVFLATGSHLLSRADWGCLDGVHSAWMMVDAESKEDARMIVPPPFRSDAKITALNKFTMEQINNILSVHSR